MGGLHLSTWGVVDCQALFWPVNLVDAACLANAKWG